MIGQWTARAVPMGELHLRTVSGPLFIYNAVVAEVLSLSIITDNGFDDCRSIQPYMFHVKYYCKVSMGVTTDQRTFVEWITLQWTVCVPPARTQAMVEGRTMFLLWTRVYFWRCWSSSRIVQSDVAGLEMRNAIGPRVLDPRIITLNEIGRSKGPVVLSDESKRWDTAVGRPYLASGGPHGLS